MRTSNIAIHEDQSETLIELRRSTAESNCLLNGIIEVSQINIVPHEAISATIVFTTFIEHIDVDRNDMIGQKWEVICSEMASADSIPVSLIARAQVKLFEDHPILWPFEGQIYYTLKNRPANLENLLGDLFTHHSKACGNWVDFQLLYRGLPASFEHLGKNQLAIPRKLERACFDVFERHGVQYHINSVENNEGNFKVLFF